MSERLPASGASDPVPGVAAGPPPTSRLPVAVAGVVAVVVIVVAVVFLRSEDGGRVVYPNAFTETGPSSFVSESDDAELTTCEVVDRVEVDFADDGVRVQWVIDELDDCTPVPRPGVQVSVETDEPLEGRRLLGGIGTTPVPCVADRSGFRCEPAR